jgi:transmembrane sensor
LFSVICAFLISIQKSAIDHGSKQLFATITEPRQAEAAEITYSTALGEHLSVTIADGSQLQLNTSSQANVEVTARSRKVSINRGEAVLTVAAGARPLLVRLDSIELETAAPSRAHLRSDGAGVILVDMLEGDGMIRAVNTSARFPPLRVRAGSSFSLQYDVRILQQFDPSEMSRRLAWTQGQVILAGETLRDAVAEFNRYNRRQLVIGDDSIANLPTGGIFYTTEIDTFALSLNKLFGIRAVRFRPSASGGVAPPDVVMLVGADYSGI